jgi:hypothetical protein
MSAMYRKSVTVTSILMLVSLMLIGDQYVKVAALFTILGVHLASESYFYKSVVPDFATGMKDVTEDFIKYCRHMSPDLQDLHVIVDAGWSHPGWWARECTVIAVDAKTGLPIAVKHVIRGLNYKGSSKGK